MKPDAVQVVDRQFALLSSFGEKSTLRGDVHPPMEVPDIPLLNYKLVGVLPGALRRSDTERESLFDFVQREFGESDNSNQAETPKEERYVRMYREYSGHCTHANSEDPIKPSPIAGLSVHANGGITYCDDRGLVFYFSDRDKGGPCYQLPKDTNAFSHFQPGQLVFSTKNGEIGVALPAQNESQVHLCQVHPQAEKYIERMHIAKDGTIASCANAQGVHIIRLTQLSTLGREQSVVLAGKPKEGAIIQDIHCISDNELYFVSRGVETALVRRWIKNQAGWQSEDLCKSNANYSFSSVQALASERVMICEASRFVTVNARSANGIWTEEERIDIGHSSATWARAANSGNVVAVAESHHLNVFSREGPHEAWKKQSVRLPGMPTCGQFCPDGRIILGLWHGCVVILGEGEHNLDFQQEMQAKEWTEFVV